MDAPEVAAVLIYGPTPDPGSMSVAPTTPLEFGLTVAHCVGTDGKISQAAVLGDDPQPALSEAMVEIIARWRYKPARVDDRLVETCFEQTFEIERRSSVPSS